MWTISPLDYRAVVRVQSARRHRALVARQAGGEAAHRCRQKQSTTVKILEDLVLIFSLTKVNEPQIQLKNSLRREKTQKCLTILLFVINKPPYDNNAVSRQRYQRKSRLIMRENKTTFHTYGENEVEEEQQILDTGHSTGHHFCTIFHLKLFFLRLNDKTTN